MPTHSSQRSTSLPCRHTFLMAWSRATVERSRLVSFKDLILGKPKNPLDPKVFHQISLVAFLAWVGLGADGLSSSAYGPEEAYLALGQHYLLALPLAMMMAFTVFIISASYSQIIELFPTGGGGYLVATKLLGEKAGLVSGSALVVDYMLTITISVASGADALFSFLPPSVHGLKLFTEVFLILGLIFLNLRGTKESVQFLLPIFLLFVLTHIVAISLGVGTRIGELPTVASTSIQESLTDMRGIGIWATLAILLHAYSLGGGTYTGIEAVSNGLQILREPRVETGKRTMLYMSVSLAFTASGIVLCYLLLDVHYLDPDHTMNSLLAAKVAGNVQLAGLPVGKWFVFIALLSEALLLFVAAQAGFIDGPRVMANMAHDSWLPHRFSALSDRLTMQNGVLLMGITSLAMLVYTGGSVSALVVMYAINVFVTFSLSQAGMLRYWLMADTRRKHPDWASHIWIHVVALVMCVTILIVNILEKFTEGAWLTVVVTGALIALCLVLKRHYRGVFARLKRLDTILEALPTTGPAKELHIEKRKPTAVLLVASFSGLGIHSLLTVVKLFPRYFHNVVFMSVAVVDSATFHGVEEVDRVREETETALQKYVDLARRMGIPADYRMSVGTEAVAECERLATEVAREYERSIFFAGKLIFEREQWWDRFLHNETAIVIQRRLQFAGLAMVILPVRVLE